MGCANSTPINLEDGKMPLRMNAREQENIVDLASPVAFVVPLHEDDSLIKKHPPKKFQKLEEQQASPPPITLKMLQDKLAEAEQRRTQILNEKIESAKISMKPRSGNGKPKIQEIVPQPINVEG